LETESFQIRAQHDLKIAPDSSLTSIDLQDFIFSPDGGSVVGAFADGTVASFPITRGSRPSILHPGTPLSQRLAVARSALHAGGSGISRAYIDTDAEGSGNASGVMVESLPSWQDTDAWRTHKLAGLRTVGFLTAGDNGQDLVLVDGVGGRAVRVSSAQGTNTPVFRTYSMPLQTAFVYDRRLRRLYGLNSRISFIDFAAPNPARVGLAMRSPIRALRIDELTKDIVWTDANGGAHVARSRSGWETIDRLATSIFGEAALVSWPNGSVVIHRLEVDNGHLRRTFTDVLNGTLLWDIVARLEWNAVLCSSPDGTTLLVEADRQYQIIDVISARTETVRRPQGVTQCTLAGIDGRTLVATTRGRSGELLASNGGELVTLGKFGAAIDGSKPIIGAKGSNLVVCANVDGLVSCIDISTRRLMWTVKFPGTRSTALAVHPEVDRIVLAFANGELAALKLSDGDIVWRFDTGGREIVAMGASWLHGLIVTSSRDAEISIWKLP
jgi:outer membrane protein assembly factor BamB